MRQVVVDRLGDPDGVLVVDLKKGVHTVGVQRQYTGTAGRIENAQVGVSLAYAGSHGHTLIDRRVYLPKSWTDDRQRCEQAAIPDTIEFATRSELADAMVTAAIEAGVPARWAAADKAYGNNTKLRARLRELRLGYVMAVSCDHLVPSEKAFARRQEATRRREAAERRRREQEAAAAKAERLVVLARHPARVWKQVDTLIEAKRAKEYDAAVTLLEDLHALAVHDDDLIGFAARMGRLREQNTRRPSLIDRFDRAQLP